MTALPLEIKVFDRCISRENPTGSIVWKMRSCPITKRKSRGTCSAEQRTGEPERGEIPLRGETGFCSQKKEIRFMSSQASSGCKHFQSRGKNSVAQLNKVELTDRVGEWVGQKFKREDFFFLANLAFSFSYQGDRLFNYLLLCFQLKCWFAFLFNLALSGGLSVSVVVLYADAGHGPSGRERKSYSDFFFFFFKVNI